MSSYMLGERIRYSLHRFTSYDHVARNLDISNDYIGATLAGEVYIGL